MDPRCQAPWWWPSTTRIPDARRERPSPSGRPTRPAICWPPCPTGPGRSRYPGLPRLIVAERGRRSDQGQPIGDGDHPMRGQRAMDESGFSFVEMAVVLLILAIVMAIVMRGFAT